MDEIDKEKPELKLKILTKLIMQCNESYKVYIFSNAIQAFYETKYFSIQLKLDPKRKM